MCGKFVSQGNALRLTRRTGQFLAVLLVLACLIGTLIAPVAHAAETTQVTLTVEQLFARNGESQPPNEVFTYQLTPQTPAAPMPAGSNVGGYTFTIDGNNAVQIGPINTSAAGTYAYTLNCVTGDAPGYTVDRRAYTIEVYVSDDIDAATVIYIGGDGKVPALVFEHAYTYTAPASPKPPGGETPSTPNPPGGETPSTPNPPGGEMPNSPNSPGGESPNSPNSPGGPKGDGPKTGDFSNPAFWNTLITVSCALLIFIAWLAWKVGLFNKRARRGAT